MQNTLVTNVRQGANGVGIIDISGELNGFSEEALMDAYNEAGGGSAVILNFTDLDYMNSSGIGLLVTLLIRVQRKKQQLLAYGLSDHYQEIFELTRLDEAIEIYDNEADAVASVAAGAPS